MSRAGELGRAVGWVAGFYGVAVLSAALIAAVFPLPAVPERLEVFTQTLPLAIGAAIATAAAALVRKDVKAVGWPGATAAARGSLAGAGWGAVMAAGALLVAVMGGARWVTTSESGAAYLAGLAFVLVGIAVAALGEELLFRGFPLTTLTGAIGPAGAVAGLSILFTLLHAGNPAVTPLGLANILLASVVLSAAFFTRGALAAAWGVHAAWNGGLVVADAPVSGVRFDLAAIDFAPGSLDWVGGGSFGPEGGVAASLALGGGLAWITARMRYARPGVMA